MFLFHHQGTGEHQNGNEPWGSLKDGEFLGYLSNYQILTDTAPCVVKALSPKENIFYNKNHTTGQIWLVPGKNETK